MREPSSSFAEVRFLDRNQVLSDLREAGRRAREAHPEITRILLFGSLVRGNWTAASDADLIVVVRREFQDLLERSRYQIHVASIHTDTLVYSETEFAKLSADPAGFLATELRFAIDLTPALTQFPL